MNILISNDDGINSNALKTLVKTLSEIGDIYVVAPDSERSANSHHFTFKGRMQVEEVKMEGAKKAYALWGTPCDCIHCGLQFLIKEPIDVVVSGINKGWNVDSDEIYSGTIAAAREGFIYGKKAFAFSLNTFEERDFKDASIVARNIITLYNDIDFKKDYYLNVNIPDMPLKEMKGYKVCDKKGRVEYDEHYSYETEDGINYVKIGKAERIYKFDRNDMEIDCNAVDNGYITITPLNNDHIEYKKIDEVKSKIKQ